MFCSSIKVLSIEDVLKKGREWFEKAEGDLQGLRVDLKGPSVV
jgi:hypothetical protein